VGFSKSQTLINFLYYKICKQEVFDLWLEGYRNLIDVEDVYKICNYLMKNSISCCETLNVASPFTYSVVSIVSILEIYLNKKAIFVGVDRGKMYGIDVSSVSSYYESSGVYFDKNYLEDILKKYFSDCC